MPLRDAYTAPRSRRVVAAVLGASGAAKMPFYEPADRAHLPRHRSSTVHARARPPRTEWETLLHGWDVPDGSKGGFNALAPRCSRARVPLSRCLLRLLPPPPLRSLPTAGKARSSFRLILPATSTVACARALGPYRTAAISALAPAWGIANRDRQRLLSDWSSIVSAILLLYEGCSIGMLVRGDLMNTRIPMRNAATGGIFENHTTVSSYFRIGDRAFDIAISSQTFLIFPPKRSHLAEGRPCEFSRKASRRLYPR